MGGGPLIFYIQPARLAFASTKRVEGLTLITPMFLAPYEVNGEGADVLGLLHPLHVQELVIIEETPDGSHLPR